MKVASHYSAFAGQAPCWGLVLILLALGAGSGTARAQDFDGLLVLPSEFSPPRAEQPIPDADAEEVARQGELRLLLLEAQLLLATGRLGAAQDAYQRLRTQLPDSAAPLAGLGAVARETGRLRLARALHREALSLAPDDVGIAASLAELERQQAPRLRTDLEHRMQRGGIGSDRADITIGEIGGQAPLSDGWRLGATQGIARVDSSAVRRAGGAVAGFTGDRLRTEITLQYEWMEGGTVTASVFGNEWTGGFGLLGRLPDDQGHTTLRADYHRPVWDFVEGIISGATRDRLAVERTQRFTTDLTGRLEAGLNRYGIPRDDDDILQSATLRGELRLGGLAGITGLSLAYVLDAEYVGREDRRLDRAGFEYQPLPIVDREVHAGLLGYGASQAPSGGGRLIYQLSAGYGADRYGRSGPLAFASMGYELGAFEVVARAGYVRNIGRSQGETTTVGLAVHWVF
jgi:hypothetical protein